MKRVYVFIETIGIISLLLFIVWEFGGLKRLATPTMHPTCTFPQHKPAGPALIV